MNENWSRTLNRGNKFDRLKFWRILVKPFRWYYSRYLLCFVKKD
jgi:hypothetical protein